MRRSTAFFAVGLAVLGLQGMTAAAALGAAGDPVPGSPFASLAAVLQAIPADLMPPGIMTDEQAAALKAWSTQRLGEALVTAELTVESVDGLDGREVTVMGIMPKPMALHGRTARCLARVRLKGPEEVAAVVADLQPGALISITGRLERAEPLVPVRGMIPVGVGGRMGVTGWSAKDAFFEVHLVEGRSPVIKEAAPPPEKGKAPPVLPPPSPTPTAAPAPTPTVAVVPAPSPTAPATEFYGVAATGAAKIIYIIDRSGSMTDSIDFVKYEAKRSIGQLPEGTAFHVIFYSSGPPVEMPTRKLVEASEANKLAAFKFIDSIVPQGETDPSLALERAFTLKPDAIYLLTDGEFDKIIAARIAKLNADRAVKVHTIAFLYQSGAAILKEIAEQNGGTYKLVTEADLKGVDLKAPIPTSPKK